MYTDIVTGSSGFIGLNLIKKGSIENEWSIHLNDVLDNWKSGCIIRTKLFFS